MDRDYAARLYADDDEEFLITTCKYKMWWTLEMDDDAKRIAIQRRYLRENRPPENIL